MAEALSECPGMVRPLGVVNMTSHFSSPSPPVIARPAFSGRSNLPYLDPHRHCESFSRRTRQSDEVVARAKPVAISSASYSSPFTPLVIASPSPFVILSPSAEGRRISSPSTGEDQARYSMSPSYFCFPNVSVSTLTCVFLARIICLLKRSSSIIVRIREA